MLTPYNWSKFHNNQRTVISPLGESSIKIKFKCSQDGCESWVYPEDLEIPIPNYAADNNEESETTVNSEIHCPKCDELFEITLSNSFGGCDIFISNVNSEDVFYKEIDEELESLLNTTNYYELFEQTINRIEEYIDQSEDDNYLNNLLLLSCIASMESYLTKALIKMIEGNEKRYIRALKAIGKFDFNNHIESIFENDLDKIKSSILSAISGESFHNHKKIKKYYEDILELDIDFDFSTFGRIIQRRHDIVHRNGITKEGERLQIDHEQLKGDINEINRFIDHINLKLQEL